MTNEYGYNHVEFQCFGWSPLSQSSLPPAETFGLDYESARECTPRWYGVSSGNGNDGVSHTFPNYYVRTNDPFRLAEIACVSSLNKEYQEWGMSMVEVDGEREYTISATILNPPDDEEDNLCKCGACEETFDEDFEVCPNCGVPDQCYEIENEADASSWCDANGAWLIFEVFPVDPMPGAAMVIGGTVEFVEYNPFEKPAYCSLEDAFSEKELSWVAVDV